MKSCLIINFWFGNRRDFPPIYGTDRLIYLKSQLNYLTSVKMDLDTIYFNFNIEKSHYNLLTDALNLTPKYINNTKIAINIRKNKGMSYGAWNDIIKQELDNFDYYIFNEDDYFFVEDNWDTYLINKYNSYKDCGYLAMGVRPNYFHNKIVNNAFHSVGMVSLKNIKKVLSEQKDLIISNNYYNNIDEYYIETQENQQHFVNQYHLYGLKNYDIREDYKVEFGLVAMDRKEDIWILWDWNKKYFIKNAKSILQPNYTWWKTFDPLYLQDVSYLK